MNRMFHGQIDKNVEVYVDDMLFKSKEEDSHLDDLRETFKKALQVPDEVEPK